MKTTQFLLLIALAFGGGAAQANPFKKSPEKLDGKIRKLTVRFDVLQSEPENRIPAGILAQAKGLVILHQLKAGLIIGGQAGGGVALVRDSRTGAWSPPAFVAAAEGSWGVQIGAQETDVVYVIMEDAGMKLLRDGSLNIGVDIQATAGPTSEGGEAKIDTVDSPILVYSSAGGLYAGAAIEGGGITEASKNNRIYYGHSLNEILFKGQGRMTPSGQKLVDTIRKYSGRNIRRGPIRRF